MSSLSCGTPGCRQPKYTPGGTKNFMCKYWMNQNAKRQEEIVQQLDRNAEKAKKAFEKQFDLDKLLNMREKFRNAEREFDARNFVINRIKEQKPNTVEVVIPKPTLGNLESFERAIPQLEKVERKVTDVSISLEELKKPIPDLFDPRAKEVIERHNRILSRIVSNMSEPLPTPSSDLPSQATTLFNKQVSELKDLLQQQQQVLDQQAKSINFLLTKYSRSSVPLTEPSLRALEKTDELDEEYFMYCMKWSKFTVRMSKHRKPAIFVCHSFKLASQLYSMYPNVFSVIPNTDWNSTVAQLPFTEVYPEGFHRIIIVPDFNLIPDKYRDTRIAHLEGEYKHYSDVWNESASFNQSFMIQLDLMKYFQSPKVSYSFQSYDRLHVPTVEQFNDEFLMLGDNYKYVLEENYT